MIYFIILRNTLYKKNSFAITKIKAILFLVKVINKKKSSNLDVFNNINLTFNRRDSTNINKAIKILGRSKDIKIPNIRHIFFKSKHITFS